MNNDIEIQFFLMRYINKKLQNLSISYSVLGRDFGVVWKLEHSQGTSTAELDQVPSGNTHSLVVKPWHGYNFLKLVCYIIY